MRVLFPILSVLIFGVVSGCGGNSSVPPVVTPPASLPVTNGLPFAAVGAIGGGDIMTALGDGAATVTGARVRSTNPTLGYTPITVSSNMPDVITLTIDERAVNLTRGQDNVYRNGDASFGISPRSFAQGSNVSMYSFSDPGNSGVSLIVVGNETNPTSLGLPLGSARYDVDILGVAVRTANNVPQAVGMRGTGNIDMSLATTSVSGNLSVQWVNTTNDALIDSTNYRLTNGRRTANHYTATLNGTSCISPCQSSLRGNLFGVDSAETAGTGVIDEFIQESGGRATEYQGFFAFIGDREE